MAAILTGKRLEYLKATLPDVTRVAVLWDPRRPGSVPQWEESKERAKELGLTLYSMEVIATKSTRRHSHGQWRRRSVQSG